MTTEQHQGIWVWVELRSDGVHEFSQELFTPAKIFAEQFGQKITAVAAIPSHLDASAIESALAGLGAHHIIVLTHELLQTYQVEAYTQALAELAAARRPNILLAAATANARDFLPRTAIRAGGAILANVGGLSCNDAGQAIATKAILAESILADLTIPSARPQFILVRGRAFEKPISVSSPVSLQVERITPNLSAEALHTRRTGLSAPDTAGKIKLEEAEIIVSGGRGLKAPENFHHVEELAAALGAAVGASRAVVDAGWRPHSEQVGQTGKTVNPKLYIAAGISGAIQHLVGMRTSQRIIAINRDPDAAVFQVADLAVIGDVLEILPVFTQAVREYKAGVR